VLPAGLAAEIHATWEIPPIFRLIADMGHVPAQEMFRTFNMGVGMLLFVAAKDADAATAALTATGETVLRAGRAVARGKAPVLFTGNPALA
jgi:phosphoribosylformylglycinamidine cyclo-ligase